MSTGARQAQRERGTLSGIEIIEWAVKRCEREKVPPTDNAIVRMIRFHLIDVSDAERQHPGPADKEER